jgi:uncharacterized MAPEG superfamily protein
MTTELGILALYGGLIVLTVLAQVMMAIVTQEIPYLVGPRDETREPSVVTGRLKRALDNNVVAMAYFAPAVLVIQLLELNSAATLLAAQIFLAARLAYVVLYALGTPWLRTLIWVVGLLASLYLYSVALF